MRARLLPVILIVTVAATVAGCGSPSSGNSVKIQPARQFRIADFQPSRPVRPGTPTTVSFRIVEPSGQTMTRFRTGSGPHTGVHLIIVRDDLGVIIHRHPPMQPGGRFSQPITFPAPGPYRVVVDVYPAVSSGRAGLEQTNFQLFDTLRVAGAYRPQPLPKPAATTTVGGYRFHIVQVTPSPLRAIQPSFVTATVTDPHGKPVAFRPWYGALAHAIFFHRGRFEYFRTHVCSPGVGGCTSVLGASRVTGSSARPGRLTIGVLLPDSGTWRLFLQLQVRGRVLTAPFTLRVAS
ncbi:MAG TPA: hypothetical protein VFA44_12750 [Gaiellaceae bacterium]|nr:hypothetical protein [Gaiellaceae bacterium]